MQSRSMNSTRGHNPKIINTQTNTNKQFHFYDKHAHTHNTSIM